MPVTVTPTNWKRIVTAASPHVPSDFTGQILLHVCQGTVGRVEVRQSFKAKETPR
jgi:hypothetical protein